MNKILNTSVVLGASALELEPGQEAIIWLKGGRRRLATPPLSHDEMQVLLRSIMDDSQWKTLEETGRVEFSHITSMGARPLTINVFRNEGQLVLTAHPATENQ